MQATGEGAGIGGPMHLRDGAGKPLPPFIVLAVGLGTLFLAVAMAKSLPVGLGPLVLAVAGAVEGSSGSGFRPFHSGSGNGRKFCPWV